MWAKLGRRLLDFSIGFFALLGFVLVPLGEQTAFEHVKAIFSTGPAVEAGRDLLQAGVQLRHRLLGEDTGGTPPGRPPQPVRSADPSAPLPAPPPLAHASAPDAGVDASLPWPET